MKTTAQVLKVYFNQHIPDKYLIEAAMKEYALEAIKEDRKQIARTACIREEDPDEPEEFRFSVHGGGYIRDEHHVEVDKDSIINAPMIELK
jgi:hypothetical protein